MEKQEILDKLNIAFKRFGVDTSYYASVISAFGEKLKFLSSADNYNKLLKKIFSSRQINEFNSYVFEALFAYDFESKGHSLSYEAKQMEESNKSIDFLYDAGGHKEIYFELIFIIQRKKITESIEVQLKNSNFYEISLDGEDDRADIGRLQNLLLSKCQDEKSKAIKFYKVGEGIYNFIVVYVSELRLNMIDKADCMLTMYGDAGVPAVFQRKIFGLYQQLPSNVPDWVKSYYNKFIALCSIIGS